MSEVQYSMVDLEQAKKEYDEAHKQLVCLPEHSPEHKKYREIRNTKREHFETVRKALQGEISRRFDALLEDHYEIWESEEIDEILNEAKKDFPKETEYPYETTVEAVEDRYRDWFKKYFGVP